MNNEFVKKFNRIFSKYRKEPIMLYGTGKNAKRIIENTCNYNIIGLIANEHIHSRIYGEIIYSIEEAVTMTKCIIIAATASSTFVVYNRIKDMVPNNILIFNMRGTRLNLNQETNKNFSHQSSCESLINAIDGHNVISFDVFDTLIMRQLYEPKDVFKLVEENLKKQGHNIPFYNWRIKAERTLYERVENPTFDEIYENMQKLFDINQNDIKILKDVEIDFEKKVIIPRKRMMEIYNYAKNSGKIIFITSDMYFDRKYMSMFLNECGIGGYNKLFISCDINKSKAKGDMYEYIKKYIKNDDRILHIGDNYEVDIENANNNGIDSFWVMKASDMFQNSPIIFIFSSIETFNDKLLLGNILSILFNDPFVLKEHNGKIYINSAYSLAQVCISPITITFMAWLINKIKHMKNSVLLFVSRDGYYLHKLYESLRSKLNLPKSIYFYTSRVAATSAAIRNVNDIKLICKTVYDGRAKDNLRDYLEARFLIELPNIENDIIKNILMNKGYRYIEKKVLRYKDTILENSSRIRNNYLSYINKLDINQYKDVYVVDMVTQGSVVYGISKILERNIKLLAFGTYDIPNEYIRDEHDVFSLYGNVELTDFYNQFSLLEFAYASREKQFLGISDTGEKLFTQKVYNNNLLLDIQKGLDDFILNYNAIDLYWYDKIYSKKFVSQVINILNIKYSIIDKNMEPLFEVTDIVGNDNALSKIRNVL